MLIYSMCLAVILLGVYCIVSKKNLIKIIIGVAIMEYGVNLMLIMIGYKKSGVVPIVREGVYNLDRFVDPLPQALVLTSIVIGLGVTAMIVAIALRLYERYGTFDISEIRRLRG